MYSHTIERLAEKWGITYAQAEDVLDVLDAKRWAGDEALQGISHAGTIDDESTQDKLHGHTGYWISDGEYIALVTNGDPLWSDLNDENACTDAGLIWDDPETMLSGHEIAS